MTDASRVTEVSQYVHAPRAAVFAAFLNPEALASWLPPDGMIGQIHRFDPRPGGDFRLSLIYTDPAEGAIGKTSDDTDTVEGRFVEVSPPERIVWATTFDSPDPAFAGEMTITWSLAEEAGGTHVTVRCANIPAGIRLEDNETGSQHSLRKLAAWVEGGAPPARPD